MPREEEVEVVEVVEEDGIIDVTRTIAISPLLGGALRPVSGRWRARDGKFFNFHASRNSKAVVIIPRKGLGVPRSRWREQQRHANPAEPCPRKRAYSDIACN